MIEMKDVVNRILQVQDLSVLIFVSIFYLKDMKWYAWIILPGHKHNLKTLLIKTFV
jgi:hypothetical protein